MTKITPEKARELRKGFGTHTEDELHNARLIAIAAIADYGQEGGEEFNAIMRGEIGNDHVAVQAALAALRLNRK